MAECVPILEQIDNIVQDFGLAHDLVEIREATGSIFYLKTFRPDFEVKYFLKETSDSVGICFYIMLIREAFLGSALLPDFHFRFAVHRILNQHSEFKWYVHLGFKKLIPIKSVADTFKCNKGQLDVLGRIIKKYRVTLGPGRVINQEIAFEIIKDLLQYLINRQQA